MNEALDGENGKQCGVLYHIIRIDVFPAGKCLQWSKSVQKCNSRYNHWWWQRLYSRTALWMANRRSENQHYFLISFGMIISLNDLKNVALTCIIAINCNIQQCTLITRFTYRGWIINNTRHHNKPVFVVILCFLSHYLQLRIKS